MIDIRTNLRLKEIFTEPNRFPIGVELVSTRGTMTQRQTLKARGFAEDLTSSPRVAWVSITDNAGGNPQLAPVALGTPILFAGKEVVIHLSCKDMNRHALESQLWMLASHGFHNILALTGDYPIESLEGLAKPVFDIDSVGLLSVIEKMNRGLEINASATKSSKKLDSTHFYAGAVVCNFKFHENTLWPQYLKLQKKVSCGAKFIVNQIGFDSRKNHELMEFMRLNQIDSTPLIGNVYVLSPGVASLFHQMKIPGVTVSDDLFLLCQQQAKSPDKGKRFFQEFAAKQLAIYRGLGYRGGYLGGVHSYQETETIMDIEKSFSANDWKSFVREISFGRKGEFYLFEEDPQTGLCQPGQWNRAWKQSREEKKSNRNVTITYHMSKAFHSLLFEKNKALAPMATRLCKRARNPNQAPALLRWVERISKWLLFSCKDCGDCSLSEIAFLCPESQCAKNQRNGPCGGTRDEKCEVFEFECIWARAYDRMKYEGKTQNLLDHAPVIQDQGLRETSSWMNFWLGKDHLSKKE